MYVPEYAQRKTSSRRHSVRAKPRVANSARTMRSGWALAFDRRCWDVHLMTPTAHPLAELASSVAGTSMPEYVRTRLLNELARDPFGLQQFLGRARSMGRRPLLVVDQLEEVFTLCHEEFEREAFIENLLTAAHAGAASIVIALRADFYSHCARYRLCARHSPSTRSSSAR